MTTSSNSATAWSIGSNGFYVSITQYTYWTNNYYIYYSTSNQNRGWRLSTSYTNTVEKVTTEEDWTGTTLTFTGVKVGTTTVTIGDTIYTINVVEAAPSNAMTSSTLTVEYWITNAQVYTSSNTSSASSVTISSTNAASVDGVDISSLVPTTAYSNYDGWVEVTYWQSMRLDSDNVQTSTSGDDETADGTTFTHVRYYNGAWQYKTTDGVWHYFLSDDQAVAYYIRYIELTQEITTGVKDWGYSTDSTTQDTSGGKGQVALSIAVVYPDGTVSPAEDDIYSSSTVIMNYWENRNIGIIVPLNNSDYTISKITYTYGTRDSNTSADVWYSSDTITWNKVKNDAGTEWYDETVAWDTSYGTEPMVSGTASNIIWKAKNTGILILIYLEPVEKETNLTVQWVDDNDNEALISSSQIVVDSTSTTVTFLNGLIQTSAVTAGTFTLDDDAYVTNSSGVNQTINKDITIIPNVASQYASGVYYYVGAEISEDGMTLTLHYNIDTTKLTPEYVVDFGLSVEVPLSDLVENSDDVASVEITGGNAEYDSDTKILTYTPASVLTSIDPVTVRVTFNDGTHVTKAIGFVPATTVYYEEGFASYGNGWDLSGKGSWSNNTNKGKDTQETEIANVEDNSYKNYNYDDAYANDATGSEGTAASTTTKGDTLSFTFTGTGVDIFANCDSGSGYVTIRVADSNGTVQKLLFVNLADFGTYATGGTAYNTPIASVSDLDHGTYTVTIYLADANTSGFAFDGFRVYGTIDTDTDTATAAIYTTDLEDSPEYYELRNNVLAGLAELADGLDVESSTYKDDIANEVAQVYATGETGAIVFFKSADNLVLTSDLELLDLGPKNELYLYNSSTLADGTTFGATGIEFNLKTNRQVQIGLRSVTGEEVSFTITVDGTTKTYTTSSSVDMFYDLLDKVGADAGYTDEAPREATVVIKVTSGGILSITDLKVSDSTGENIFGTLTADEVIAALNVETGETATTADAALTVDLVDYTGSVVASTQLTDTGIAGDSVTFSASDILAAVDEALPEGYALVDEDSVADQAVTCGETGSVTVQIGKVATLTVTYQKYSGLFKKTTVGTVTLTKVQTSAGSRATFSSSEIKAAAPDGCKVLVATSASVSYGSSATKTVTVY